MRGILALLFIGLCTTIGCGDDEAAIPDAFASIDARVNPVPDALPVDAAPTLDLDTLCQTDNGLFVDWLSGFFDCYPELIYVLGTEPPDRVTLSTICYAMFGPFLDDGTVVLDDTHWADCLAYVAALDCTTAELDGPNPCTALVQGTIANGDDCDDSMQCVGDAFCDHSGGGDCGVCTARLADDAECSYNDQCASGLCAGSNSPPGTCRSFGQVGDDCIRHEDCAGHLRCDPFVTGKCFEEPDWQLGDDCINSDEDCGFPFSDLLCDADVTGKCIAYLDLGDPCTQWWQCDFKRYETCDTVTTHTCVLPVIVPIGAVCSFANGLKCQHDLVCTNPEGARGVCIQIPEVGDSCMTDDDCWLLQECVGQQCQHGAYSAMCPAPE